MKDSPSVRNRALDDLSEAGVPWWKRYSPHGEFPWSTAISFSLHALLLAALFVSARQFIQRDPEPPTCATVLVGPDPSAAEGEGGTDQAGADTDPVEDTVAAKDEPAMPDEAPQPEKLEELKKPTVEPTKAAVVDSSKVPDSTPSDAAQRVAALKNKLANRKGVGGGSSAPRGGSGGGGPTGRAARPSRWVLACRSSGIQDYLQQHDGIGAVFAFPSSGDRWTYYHNAGDPGRRTKEERNPDDDNRICWTTEKRSTVEEICRFLGIGRADLMVMFLPIELEERMAKMEREYANREEDEILSTQFELYRAGGRYDVRVMRQTPR